MTELIELNETTKRGPGRPRKADTEKLVGWTVHLHPVQLAALTAESAASGLSGSALIRAALRLLLDARALQK